MGLFDKITSFFSPDSKKDQERAAQANSSTEVADEGSELKERLNSLAIATRDGINKLLGDYSPFQRLREKKPRKKVTLNTEYHDDDINMEEAESKPGVTSPQGILKRRKARKKNQQEKMPSREKARMKAAEKRMNAQQKKLLMEAKNKNSKISKRIKKNAQLIADQLLNSNSSSKELTQEIIQALKGKSLKNPDPKTAQIMKRLEYARMNNKNVSAPLKRELLKILEQSQVAATLPGELETSGALKGKTEHMLPGEQGTSGSLKGETKHMLPGEQGVSGNISGKTNTPKEDTVAQLPGEQGGEGLLPESNQKPETEGYLGPAVEGYLGPDSSEKDKNPYGVSDEDMMKNSFMYQEIGEKESPKSFMEDTSLMSDEMFGEKAVGYLDGQEDKTLSAEDQEYYHQKIVKELEELKSLSGKEGAEWDINQSVFNILADVLIIVNRSKDKQSMIKSLRFYKEEALPEIRKHKSIFDKDTKKVGRILSKAFEEKGIKKPAEKRKTLKKNKAA